MAWVIIAVKVLMVNLTTREIMADLARKSGVVETKALTDNPEIKATVHLMARKVLMASLVIKAGEVETMANLKTKAGVQPREIMVQE
jgi:hypothetical protein